VSKRNQWPDLPGVSLVFKLWFFFYAVFVLGVLVFGTWAVIWVMSK